MIVDKLYKKVEENGVVCVGLDTSLDYIPNDFLQKFNSIEDALFNFNKKIIDTTYDVSACFKIQIAYYESYGIQGLKAYKKSLDYIKSIGALAIADIKRGDIAQTAKMYAKAHFTGDFESDFITLNPYMGMDTLDPYLPYIEKNEKGIFVLVRTSNPGSEDIQYIEGKDGRRVYKGVGEKLSNIALNYKGDCGYSSIGAVIGCTHIDEGIELRCELSKIFFLIPGYGAQGGKAEDVALYLKDGNGGVVNSSRAILLAYKKFQHEEDKFHIHARNEVLRMRDEISKACKRG
ncbi:orotidine-5'-phosphate decarboxylase [Clostridium sp. MSJ-4]|uniref:Orotidine 5'-phosphate decarboxylase n=1 Tax=Clostridium simiarum TaxID=2841506 RepID=A0ABS6F106_9CLOT|nr:orotidine-5'-phosphate decarboxylase [Clostridium simiarum]MBU5591933.1 orotidine-5'-phosphate decarboxylase [Clostridium simiarum]